VTGLRVAGWGCCFPTLALEERARMGHPGCLAGMSRAVETRGFPLIRDETANEWGTESRLATKNNARGDWSHPARGLWPGLLDQGGYWAGAAALW